MNKNLTRRISVDSDIFLSEIVESDDMRLVELLNDKRIHDNTLEIPYPYTQQDAESWITLNQSKLAEHGYPMCFAIRDSSATLIGGIGFDSLNIGKDHKAEIGYWLGALYWGQGIMPKCVAVLCRFALTEFSLDKITAHVFSFNQASGRVLEKCGFVHEASLRYHYRKNGELVDAKVYSLFPETAEPTQPASAL